jgi:ABC-type transport system substrate-binding protein
VKFHTGQTMTSKDVAYSFNYLRDSKNGSPGAADLSLVLRSMHRRRHDQDHAVSRTPPCR